MIKKHNNVSLLLGAPGLILQVYGEIIGQHIISLLGSILLLSGFAFYAKAKGRNPAWGLMALLSILGLIVLSCLKDFSIEETET